LAAFGPGERVVGDARVRLICAGWVPQDGVFGWSGTACLGSGVTAAVHVVAAAHSRLAGRSSRCHRAGGRRSSLWGLAVHASGMTARDQHQPASSRAMATLATVERLRRSMKGDPAGVEPPVAVVAADPGGRGGQVPPPPHGRADGV
jgi:hypothetical protein